MDQVKRHKWMILEGFPKAILNEDALDRSVSTKVEPNEQILRVMQSLGIDSHRTREVSDVNTSPLNCWHRHIFSFKLI